MSTSLFMISMEAIRDAIKTLSLTGLEDNEVKVRRLPHDGEQYYQGITVHPVKEIFGQGSNLLEEVGYGCAVTMVENNNNNSDYKLDQILLWREAIRRYFVENTTLSGVSETCTIKVETGHVIDWDELFDKNIDVSRLVIRVRTLETRT